MSGDRPRRSCLFMPATNPRALAKATGLACDAVLFDLEDAVAPNAKVDARRTLSAALAEYDYGARECVLRVNGSATPWGPDDLELAAQLPLDAVLLPKVERPQQLEDAAAALAAAGRDAMPLWVMIETPLGVLNVGDIMLAQPQPAVLVIGTNDLGRELRLPASAGRDAFAYTFGRCLLAARASGADALDGVHNDITDIDGLQAACTAARELGFDGKTLIHPGQIATANTAFSPSPDEVKAARGVVAAWQEAQRAGVGVVAHEGRMIESLHVSAAERLLALHARLGDN